MQVPEPIEEIVVEKDNINKVTVKVVDKNDKETKVTTDPKDPIVVEELPPKDKEVFKEAKKVIITPDDPTDPKKPINVKVKVNICKKPKTTPGTEGTGETTPATPVGTATPPETTPTKGENLKRSSQPSGIAVYLSTGTRAYKIHALKTY